MARRAPLRVEDAVLLEDLRNDGNGGVDGVRDDQDERLRCCGRDTGSKITNDTGVDLVIVSDGVLHVYDMLTLNRSSLHRTFVQSIHASFNSVGL